MFVPCPNSTSLAVRFCSWTVTEEEPVARIDPLPLTEVTLPVEQGETYRLPEAVALTQPAVFRLLRVVEPVTVKVEESQAALATVRPVEEALPVDTPVNQEYWEALKPEDEALAKVVCPVTFKVEDSQAALAMVMPEEEALPSVGVIKVGEVWRTARPVPVVAATNKLPEAEDSTMPAVREDKVVEPVTVRVPVLGVVAKKE